MTVPVVALAVQIGAASVSPSVSIAPVVAHTLDAADLAVLREVFGCDSIVIVLGVCQKQSDSTIVVAAVSIVLVLGSEGDPPVVSFAPYHVRVFVFVASVRVALLHLLFGAPSWALEGHEKCPQVNLSQVIANDQVAAVARPYSILFADSY